ncbi:MAG TPA: hypothetical protein VNJ47_05800 [Nevskiales bacterium]|nr:hypothetical protein [Nevskiales bacterium]
MTRVYYSPAYVAAGYAFDTTRKARWVADSLLHAPIPGIELVKPAPLTRAQLLGTHDPEYVQAVETGTPRHLAESQGFDWDPGLWEMALATNGGVVAAAQSALEYGVAGSLSSGLHHARYGSGAAFCTFNGLVIAAKQALRAGARNVLILDLDAHCGGGTASLIEDEAHLFQVDVAVSDFDYYPSTDNARLSLVREPDQYLAAVESAFQKAEDSGLRFGLCLYNAGMDPFEDCPTGGLPGITREMLYRRERMVFEWCRSQRMSIAFVLAGGYIGPDLDQYGLVDLHRMTLAASSGHR